MIWTCSVRNRSHKSPAVRVFQLCGCLELEPFVGFCTELCPSCSNLTFRRRALPRYFPPPSPLPWKQEAHQVRAPPHKTESLEAPPRSGSSKGGRAIRTYEYDFGLILREHSAQNVSRRSRSGLLDIDVLVVLLPTLRHWGRRGAGGWQMLDPHTACRPNARLGGMP